MNTLSMAILIPERSSHPEFPPKELHLSSAIRRRPLRNSSYGPYAESSLRTKKIEEARHTIQRGPLDGSPWLLEPLRTQ